MQGRGDTHNEVSGSPHLVVQGRDIQTVNIYPPTAPDQPFRAVSFPCQVGVIPLEAECFQRRAVTGVLEAGPVDVSTAVLCQVLSGSGGVGKTQVAARYARQRQADGTVQALVWLTATNRESVVSEYARAAVVVGACVDQDPEAAARAFLAWLAVTDRVWLVVLDDLSDPGDLKGLWPPAHPTGRTVVTTRRRDASLGGSGRQRLDVEVFTEPEAVGYVTAKLAAHDREDDSEQVRGLARELGYLPVALAQAVTYLLDVGMDCAGYRARWADRRRTLTRLIPQDGGLPDDQRVGLAAVWSLSMQRANTLDPVGLAGPMLELTALLDPNGIPLAVLTAPPALRYLAKQRTIATGGEPGDSGETVGAEDARDALAALARLSLCTMEPGNPRRAVHIHALIQRATRESLALVHLAKTARVVADALLEAWPAVEHDSALSLALRSNAETLDNIARDALWEPDGHDVLFRAGNSLGLAGLVAEATAYFDRLYRHAATRLGPDHPDTLAARHNLAHWQGEAGDPAGATTALEALLADRLRVLGSDHFDTLTTRDRLAIWRGEAGDVAGAVAAFRELLADQLRVLGPDHPHTLTTRSNVAYWRGRSGDAIGAVAAFRELLADRLRVLGPDHPDTLRTRSNLARSRGEAGDPAGAVAELEQVLVDRLRVLGPDHPGTLTTRGSLARWRGEAGDPAGAVAAFEELLADRLRVLGPDHPETLSTRGNLARWRGEAGDPAGAVAAFEQVLVDRLRVLGPDHPHTLQARGSLARWRGEAGDPVGAAAVFEELLTDQLRVLGPDHPDTQITRGNLTRQQELAESALGDA